MEQQISEALTSGMLAPSIGAALVIIVWLASKVRHGVPLRDQMKSAAASAWPALLPAGATTGIALMVGTPYLAAVGSGLTVLLALTNFRVPSPPSKPPPSVTTSLLVVALALGLALGTAVLTGCGAALPYIAVATQIAQWLVTALDQAQGIADVYFAQHPDVDKQTAFARIMHDARSAVTAWDEGHKAGADAHAGDLEASKAHVLAAYEEVYRFLEQLGALSATYGAAPGGGGEHELPTPAEVGARLQ